MSWGFKCFSFQPLCPDYQAGLDAANDDEKVAAVFKKLPVVTQNVLKYLANFICLLGDPKYVAQTKMEVGALCIVFVPATLKNPVFDCERAPPPPKKKKKKNLF